ncbi:MAG TPA: AraC family transcriptional regulator [Dehalococcoidia bacterium]|nr:AraC family transcriptional regulator [Dehalococcoidia bacterium]
MHPEITVERRDEQGVRSEIHFQRAEPRLRPLISRPYAGYSISTQGASRRRHPPTGIVPMIILLGDELGVPEEHGGTAVPRRSFIAGLHDSYATTVSEGDQVGMQIDFTPIGAYLFLQRPMSELANRSVELEDIFGKQANELRERLIAKESWQGRFAIAEAFIAERISHARPASPAVAWAWGRLQASAGSVGIGQLAAEIGWSRKHLIAQFREQIGMAPKTLARVLRFKQALETIESGAELHWSEMAVRCGYYDQAHFIRDFREFTGVTPGEYLTRRLPDGLED